VDPPEVTGRFVDRLVLGVGEAGIDAHPLEGVQQGFTQEFVRVHQVPRELLGGGGDPVGDVGVGIVVDAATAGLSAGDADAVAVAVLPVDGVGVLAIPHREH
jgi:hypothetical protein